MNCVRSTRLMETLPNELTLDIAMKLSARDCLALARSSKHQAWLLNVNTLWKGLAERELKYPGHLFDEQLDIMGPAQLYQHLSTCHHLMSIHETIFTKRCGRPIFPGTPYCRDHCRDHSIRICPQCQTNLVNVVNWKRTTILSGQQLCQTCDKPKGELIVVTMDRWPGYYMISSESLNGIIVQQLPDHTVVALGRLPIGSLFTGDASSLIQLTHAEKNLAHEMGLATRA
jgi:hypothetical protein